MSLNANAWDRYRMRICAACALIAILVAAGWLWGRRTSRPVGGEATLRIGNNEIKLPADAKSANLGKLIDVKLDDKAINDLIAQHRKQMLDDYFKLSKTERKAYLDKMIAQQEKMKKLVGDPTTLPTTMPSGDAGDGKAIRIVRKFGGNDAAAQKHMAEDIPPADRARLAEMVADMNARRSEMGLPPNQGLVIVHFDAGESK